MTQATAQPIAWQGPRSRPGQHLRPADLDLGYGSCTSSAVDVTLRHANDGFTVWLRHLLGLFRTGRHGAGINPRWPAALRTPEALIARALT